MHSKVESHEYYQIIRRDYDVFLLVADIKGLTFNFDGHKHPLHALHDAKRNFYRYYQTLYNTNP